MSQDLFWNLLSKKLAKEATPEELAQLEELMRQHPEWLYSAQHIQDMWALTVKKNPSASESAFDQHLNKLEEKGVDTSPWKKASKEKTIIPIYKRAAFKWLAAASVIGIIAIFFFRTSSNNSHALIGKTVNEFSTHRGSMVE